MSSFPVLHLPLVALWTVIDCWNPIEWYKISKISGKTGKITKSFRKSIKYAELKYEKSYYVRLEYRDRGMNLYQDLEGQYVSYKFCTKEIKEFHTRRENSEIFLIPSKNPAVDVLNIFEEILAIFNCPMTRTYIFADDGLTDVIFNDFITRSNSFTQQINDVYLGYANKQKLEHFFRSYKKPVDKLSTICYEGEPPEFSDFNCQSIRIFRAEWVGLKQLLAIDFVTAEFFHTRLTNREVNTFLKSWKDGSTHLKMEKWIQESDEQTNVMTILEELSPENLHRNDYNQEECRIKRNDGKTARIVFGENERPNKISVYVL